jgi:hypothetical protein
MQKYNYQYFKNISNWVKYLWYTVKPVYNSQVGAAKSVR